MSVAWLYGGGFAALLLALMAGGVRGMIRNAAPRPPKPPRKRKADTPKQAS